MAPPPGAFHHPVDLRQVTKLTMNYQRLTKNQLVSSLKEKDQEISKLVDHILELEKTHADRYESLKTELSLFARDFMAFTRFIFELGVKTRKTMSSVTLPVIVPKA